MRTRDFFVWCMSQMDIGSYASTSGSTCGITCDIKITAHYFDAENALQAAILYASSMELKAGTLVVVLQPAVSSIQTFVVQDLVRPAKYLYATY